MKTSIDIRVLHTIVCGVDKCSPIELTIGIEKITGKKWINNSGIIMAREKVLELYPELIYLQDPKTEVYTGCMGSYEFPQTLDRRDSCEVPRVVTPMPKNRFIRGKPVLKVPQKPITVEDTKLALGIDEFLAEIETGNLLDDDDVV